MSELAALRRVLRADRGPRSGRAPGERCEMCGTPIGSTHSHVVDLDAHGMLCACRPCALLFTDRAAARGRYRTVPDRYRSLAAGSLTSSDWEELQVPVGLVFLLRSSRAGRTLAFYPGPAGATECELPLGTWDRVLAANPGLAAVEPDVEAVLLRAVPHGGGFECFVVPVDACYELVGHLRLEWRGFDGGQQAHARLEDFFAALRSRATPLEPS